MSLVCKRAPTHPALPGRIGITTLYVIPVGQAQEIAPAVGTS